jgi:hypothetical protein
LTSDFLVSFLEIVMRNMTGELKRTPRGKWVKEQQIVILLRAWC